LELNIIEISKCTGYVAVKVRLFIFFSVLAAEFLITFKLTRRVSRTSVLVREFTDSLLFYVNMMQIYCMDAKIGACVCIYRSGLIHCNIEMCAEEKKSSIASFQNHRFF
jgi:hypothetical protein